MCSADWLKTTSLSLDQSKGSSMPHKTNAVTTQPLKKSIRLMKKNTVITMKNLTLCILNSLTPDLLKAEYVKGNKTNPLFGYCYIVTEALYHLIRSVELPEQYDGYGPWKSATESDPHWWLQDGAGHRLDLTADQLTVQGCEPPYDSGCSTPFEPPTPCSRTSIVIARVQFLLNSGDIKTSVNLKWYLGLLRKCGSTKYGYFGEAVYQDVMEKDQNASLTPHHSQGYDFKTKDLKTEIEYMDDVKSRLRLDVKYPARFNVASRSSRAEGRRYPHVVFYDDKVAVFDTESQDTLDIGGRSWGQVVALFGKWHRDKRAVPSNKHASKKTSRDVMKMNKEQMKNWIRDNWQKKACVAVRDSKEAMAKMNLVWGPEAFYQPLFAVVKNKQRLRKFAGCFSAEGDLLGVYLKDRFSIFAEDRDGILSVHNQIEAAQGGEDFTNLSRTLEVELSKIACGECIFENARFWNIQLSQRASELLGKVSRNPREEVRLNLELLKSAYPTYLVEKETDIVVLVYYDQGEDYEVCAYPLKERFHEIAWFPKPLTDPHRRMSFAPGLLAEEFIFEDIQDFKDSFMNRFWKDFQ